MQIISEHVNNASQYVQYTDAAGARMEFCAPPGVKSPGAALARMFEMNRKRILISGGGIAGLTLAIQLKQSGFDPLVVEREAGLRREGYMMDFFGSGWDVANRMGLTERLRAIRYPIDFLEFVDSAGKAYVHVPIERVRHALGDKYVYLRRQDLEGILTERARELGVELRYSTALAALEDRGTHAHVKFESGGEDDFALVVGADGVHSRVRGLVFGPERQFAHFLGLMVAAFHVARGGLPVERMVKLYEETDRLMFLYPLDRDRLDATFVFRHPDLHVPHGERIDFLCRQLRGAGWLVGEVLAAHTEKEPVFFDSATQIAMPQWHKGRVALIGDACGCLTLLAGQGSHMAMTGGYVLAQELARHDDPTAAFSAYQAFLKPQVDKRRRDAARFAGIFVPSARSHPWLRRVALRLMFSKAMMKYGLRFFGSKSVLAGRAGAPASQ
jgi:2-polyprenyl-6-methoxyphenol hydroxylase-like FAD-dependent oxidoreductase